MATKSPGNELPYIWPGIIDPATVHNDPSLPGYWHLGGTSGATKGVNVVDVWDEFRGAGVVIAIVDDGVEYTHPELAANYALALDYDARDIDFDAYPSDPTDRHGTAVAGTAAAALDNGIGGAGVAPGATIVGFRMGFNAAGSLVQVERALSRIDDVDVANNSWSYDGFLGDNFQSSFFAPSEAYLQEALDDGRGGLGTIITFAAGNARTSGQDVNYHSFQNFRGSITVAATDSAGNVAGFSTPGDAILVAAPGQGIQTTDRVGSFGYSAGDSTTLNGTSFSTPIVSGVAALMLEANPGLGWRDVQEILALTATQTGAAAGWSFNHAANWNGGAMHVSRDLGFGLVDAMAAVRVAESWHLVSTSANEFVVSNAMSTSTGIPDAGSLERTLVLSGGVLIDHVEVDVAILHSNISQLRVLLSSPTGTQSVLFNNAPTSQDNIFFTFTSTHHWGEDSAGAWTLTILDTVAGTTGTFQGWAIRAYGDVAGNDTYVYTDEFGSFADAMRRTLVDASGSDGINTAAIASSTILDLRPGFVSQIDGQSVTIGAGTVIENADTGDGNDTLVGNHADNWLRGWRGNDTLDGGDGADRLDGGPGNDALSGGGDNDLYVFDPGFGTDSITDVSGSLDVVRFGAGIAPGAVAASRSGVDLLLASGGNAVSVRDWFASDAAKVERVEFTGSTTVWDAAFLRAETNLAPTLASPLFDQAAGVAVPFEYQLPAGAFADADSVIGDTLAYTAGLAGGGLLPAWLGFDAGTRSFTGTPTSADLGTFSVTVTATDNLGESVSDDFVLAVGTEINTTPIAVDDGVAVTEDGVTANLAATLLANDSDADPGDVLRIAAVGTAGTFGTVSFDAGAQTLSYSADGAVHDALALNASTTDSFTYTLSDGAGGFSNATVNVTITGINDAPVLSQPLADQGATAGVAFAYAFVAGSFSDVDAGDVLSYAATRSDGSALPGWLQFNAGTRSFSGTPAFADAGLLNVLVTATDSQGVAVSDQFALSVSDGGVVLNGTPNSDTLNGTAGSDTINGLAGNDTLNGLEGNDLLVGGVGIDTMNGGAGDDTFQITGTDGVNYDVVNGGEGFDRILGSGGDDTFRLWNYSGANTVELIDGGGGVNVIATVTNLATALNLSGTQLVNIARIEGGAGNDSITGSAGNDTIIGGAGVDTLVGGAGDDTFLMTGAEGTSYDQVSGGADFDRILGSAGNDTIRLWSYTGANTVEQIDGGAGENVIAGSATAGTILNLSGTQLLNIARIEGGSGNDNITGSTGNDTINAGAGNDTMAGGLGDDVYYVDATGDVVSESAGQGIDTVNASISYTLLANFENLNLSGSALNATGNAAANAIAGNALANVIDGGAGNDTLTGGAGNDTYLFSAGHGQDTVIDGDATAGNHDIVRFGAGIAAAEVAASRSGFDLRLARAGDSVTVQNWYRSDADKVESVEFTSSGTAWSAALLRAMTNLAPVLAVPLADQSATTGQPFSFQVPAGAFTDADSLIGEVLSYSATLDGGGVLPAWLFFNAGTRSFSGTPGAGDAGSLSLLVTATDSQGIAVSDAFLLDIAAGSSVINGTPGDDILTGTAGDDTINGLGGDDTLDGGAGVDTLAGGTGNDTYIVDSATDVIVESFGEGSDGVHSSISYSLAALANVENVVLTGTDATEATGNAADNTLTGNSADNVLDGGAGVDTMLGGLGDDTYIVNHLSDVIVENAGEGTDLVLSSFSYVMPGNVENLSLVGGIPAYVFGNDLDNLISGNSADNQLDGGAGADTMSGGAGHDSYYVDDAGDVVNELAGEGTDRVYSTVSFSFAATPHLENLYLRGAAAIDATGNALDNHIEGNDANNVLDGGGGVDTLRGFLGDDSYVVDSTTDTIDEIPGQGIDTVRSSVTFSLGPHVDVENLVLTGADAVNATGNAGANALTGNDAANLLEGGAGNDLLSGGAGSDLYLFEFGHGQDSIIDSAGGLDVVRFSSGILPAGVTASRAGLDLVLAHGSGAVSVENWYRSDADKVENIEFTASATVWDVAQLRAMTNLAPVVAVPLADQAASAGEAVGIQVPADTFADADSTIGDTLAWSAALVGGGALPAWLGFNAATRSFAGTPGASDAGNLDIRVTATDSQGASASDDFVLTIASPANSAPVNTVPGAQAALEDTVLVFSSGAGNAISVADATSAELVVRLGVAAGSGSLTPGSSPALLTIAGSGTATLILSGPVAEINAALEGLMFLPAANSSGAVVLSMQSGDGGSHDAGLTDADSVAIDVAPVNDAPVLTQPLSDQDATAGVAFGYVFAAGSFSDVDAGDVLSYAATRADGSPLPGWLLFNAGTRSFSGTPGAGDAGLVNVLVTATDSQGASVSDVFALNVAATTGSVINGTAGNDTLNGTAGNDTINGLAGNDTINGHDGNDTIVGGVGNDTMNGGAGDDTFQITGTDGLNYDIVNGGADFDQIVGSAGDDTIRLWNYTAANTVERIDGGGGVNVITTVGHSTPVLNFSGTQLLNIARIEGGGGTDIITGSAGNDTIVGGANIDTLSGGAGDDTFLISGTDGLNYDTISGGADYDRIAGSAGNDTFRLWNYTGANTVELIDGAGGTDVVAGHASIGTVLNFSATQLMAIARIEGGTGADTITGSTGNDTINGGAGNDTLNGWAGADLLEGGAGNDIFAFRSGEAAGDVVSDFTGNGIAAGDSLRFTGFGAGATLAQEGASDYWTIHYGALSETVQLVGVTSLAAGDYMFA